MLTRADVKRMDQLALERFGLPTIVLMENAARAVAIEAIAMTSSTARVLVVCGGGNNGGDGLAAARHLSNAGRQVHIGLAVPPEKITGDAAVHLHCARQMGLPIQQFGDRELPVFDLIIDAIFGVGLSDPPRADADALLARLSQQHSPILAVDVPSGLDADTGQPLTSHCVRAARTVTMAATKSGFANAGAFTGEVIIGDIGVPRSLIDEVIGA